MLGLSPCEAAHSGTMVCRVARAAEMIRTPVPRVSRVRRCCAQHRQHRRVRPARARAVAALGARDVRQERGQRGRGEAHRRGEAVRGRRSPRPETSAAPTNGPMNSPTRNVPPSVDSARARIRSGTVSVRYACRARLNTAPASPVTKIASASSHSERARNAPSRATASTVQAATRAFCSPIRAARAPAGRSPEELADPDQRHDEGGHARGSPRGRAPTAPRAAASRPARSRPGSSARTPARRSSAS